MKNIIFLIAVSIFLNAYLFSRSEAQIAPDLNPVTNTDGRSDEEEEEEHDEGRGAIVYWQELEKKISHVNQLNGVNVKNRQHFKVADWEKIHKSKQDSRIASSVNGNWTQVYQSASSTGMGRVETVAFSPADANVFFIGTAGGGLWRTNNNGTSYFPVTDGLPSSGVTSIVIDPNNANNMYILTGSGLGGQSASSAGVFRSTDGGSSWFQTGLTDTIGGTDPLYGFDMKMHPTNPDILFCATNRGLYKTVNAGVFWELVLDGELSGYTDYHSIFDIEFKPDDASVVYAAYYNRIYYSRSTGNAGTWATSASEYAGYPAGFEYFYASRICVSAAAPNSVHIASAVEGNDAFDASNGSVFYIKGTFNPGAASNAITYLTPRKVSACNFPCQRSGGGRAYGDIYVSQSNESNIIIGGLEFYASATSGTSWITKSYNCVNGTRNFHVDCGSKITVQNGFTYVVSDGGIYRQAENYTAATGGAWTNITGDIEITQLYTHDGSPQDANYYLYANQDNDVHVRTSVTSYISFIGGDGTACKFDKSNKNNYYGSIQNGEFLRRNLSGTVTDITPGAGANNGDEKQYSGAFVFARCFNIDENNNNTLYAIKRSFYKSINQGTNWTRYDIPGAVQPHVIMRVARSQSQYVYAVETDWYDAANGYLYHPQKFRTSTNGGSNWTERTINLPANIIISDLAVDPADASRIYITCYGNVPNKKFFRSLDGGGSWFNLSIGLPNVDARCIALVNETKKGIYVGTDLGVYYRDDNLSNWTRFSNGLPIVQVMNLYLNTTLQTLSAATFGRGIFVTDLYDYNSCPLTLSLNSLYFGNTVYASSTSISSAGIIYPSSETNVTFSSGNNIILQPGFVATYGSGFRATMEGCDPQAIPYRIQPLQRDSTGNIIKPKNTAAPLVPVQKKQEGLPGKSGAVKRKETNEQ